MDCDFCERFNYLQEDDFKPPKGIKVSFKVSLVEEHLKRNGLVGKTIYSAQEFSYCPVCGTKLKEEGQNT